MTHLPGEKDYDAPAPSPPVARNAFHLFLGQAATTALSILLNAVLARALGAADFGLLYLVTSMANFAHTVVDWGQASYLVREVARRPERAGDLLGTSLALRVVGAVLVCVPTLLVAWVLGYDARTRWLALVMLAATLPLVLVQRYTVVFRGRERMDYEAVVTVLAKALTLALTVAALAVGGGCSGPSSPRASRPSARSGSPLSTSGAWTFPRCAPRATPRAS